MRIAKISVSNILILAAALSTASLFAQLDGEVPASSDQASQDAYMSGATIQVPADVEGDLIVAGGILNIDKSVSGDVLAAGAIVNITADTGDDIRAAGASVTITGDVGDDVVVAAGSVTIGADSMVGGHAWLAGNTITVAGNVSQTLTASGREVIIAGTIGGDVEINADAIEVVPNAVIKGKLTYSAPQEVLVHKGAMIEGTVNRQEFVLDDVDTWGAGIIGSLKFYLSLAIAAVVLFLTNKHTAAKVVGQLREAPLKSAGLGLLVLVSTPIIALILLITGLGLPLGLIALTVYGFALVAGLLVGMSWIGDTGFRLFGKNAGQSNWTRTLSIAVAALILLIVGFIPYVGSWIFFIVVLLGIGALQLYAYRLHQGLRDSPLATT